MAELTKNKSEGNQEEKTVELPVLTYFGLNFISFILPLYPCMSLFLLYLYIMNLFSIDVLWIIFFSPSVLLVLLYFYILILIEFAAMLVRRWIKKSPPEEGIFSRVFLEQETIDTRRIKYYHLRGFIIKFPVWLSSKSPFPWLVNRTLRRIGHNKIGNNVIMEDVFVGLEFTNIEDNVYIYPTGAVSSHSVNSIFGKLNIFEILINENSIIYPGNISGPGAHIDREYVILPNTVIHKHWKGKEDTYYYQGSPGRPIEYKGIDKKNEGN